MKSRRRFTVFSGSGTGGGRWDRPQARLASAAVVYAVGSGLILAGCGSALQSKLPGAESGTVSSPVAGIPADPRLEVYYRQKLDWAECEGSFECATAKVPLDYADPESDSLGIALLKLPAADQAARVGSLFVNPGGPGNAGTYYAAAAVDTVGPSVRARYDVVGFDPRGTGGSSPINCGSDADIDRLFFAGEPDASTSLDAMVREAVAFGQGCVKNFPALVPRMGTVTVAKDLDILRAAVGDSKLNYLGKSYGSFLGVTYADLFTGNVGRLVLDGAVDPRITMVQRTFDQVRGFERSLGRFVADCYRYEDCPLPSGRGRGIAAIRSWLADLGRSPARVKDRILNQALAVSALGYAMYVPESRWSRLRRALSKAFAGDGELVLGLAEESAGRQPDGSYSSYSSVGASYAVNCLDYDDRLDLEETRRLATSWSAKAPTFGDWAAWGTLVCSNWPVPATDSPHPIHASGSGPILVIGTQGDSATPYEWSQAVAEQLDNAALLTWDGNGHTAYRRESPCVDEQTDQFLVSGILPARRVNCGR